MANLKDLIVNGSTRLNSDVTISGKTTLGGDPTSDNEAATKKYVDDSIPSVPSPADATPLMDGTAAVGTSTDYAREDHVHPSDTTKVNKVNSSTDNAVVRFDGTSGAIQNSSVTVNDSGYLTASKIIKSGGTSSQFLKADGSVDTNTYLTSQVQSDWKQTNDQSVDFIKNKPDISYVVLAEKTFDPYTITAADTEHGYLFFLNVVPTSDNYYEPWRIKYKLSIITSEDQTQGIYDCELGTAGTVSMYSFFNRFYSTNRTPSRYHIMAFHNSATKYADRATNPVKIGECINGARLDTTLARTFKIQVIEAVNCTISFPDDIEVYNDVYTDAKYGNCSTLDSTTLGLQETSDLNYPNYYNYEYFQSYRIHGTDTPLYRYKFCGFDEQDHLVPITSTNQTDATIVTKTPNTVPMDVSKGLVWYNGTIVINNLSNSAANGTIYRSESNNQMLNYNFNTAISANKNVFLVGSYDAETGMFTLDTTSQDSYYLYAPNDETLANYLTYFTTGKYYWLIGNTTTSYVNFLIDNPLFYFDGTNLISVDAASYNSMKDYVDGQISQLPTPMVYKGTLGTGGTITALPVNGTANIGDTYKVITAGTYASQSAKVGDVFICDGKTANSNTWSYVPAGDDVEDTWRNIKVNGTERFTTAISSGAVDFNSSTDINAVWDSTNKKITYTHSNSITAGTAGSSSAHSQTGTEGGNVTFDVPYITYNGKGHITAAGTHTETITLPEHADMESITWSNLKTARDGGTLKPGKWYRITDYVTTTAQTNTQSAGHQFDIIVVADSTNKLNENAYAAIHTGDTYFQNSNLDAWELKYCIDNDTTRFAWADSTSGNGKGVIYYMKDEWNNECPYDFKNIQFKRYKITACTKSPSLVGLYGITGASDYTVDNSTPYWCYTFCVLDTDDYAAHDVSVEQELYPNDEGYYNHSHDNVFKPYYTSVGDDEMIEVMVLPNNVCITDTSVIEGDAFYAYYSNTFGNYCNSNTFGNDCYSNTFGNDCNSNTFGNYCNSNTFGNSCYYNTFGYNCNNNTFENSCSVNTFGYNCNNNTFENSCYFNTFENECYYNTFESGCNHIQFSKNYTYYCIVENGNQCIILTSTQQTSSNNQLRNIIIAQGVNNTNSNINISHNTVNDAFQTIYAKDSSGNLKSWVSADIETSYSDTDHNLSGYRGLLAKRKVYTNVLGVANGSSPNNNTYANRSVYFLTVHPRSFDSEWTIHYRVNIHLDDEDKLYKSSSTASVINLGQLCRGTYDCILSGTASTYTVYSSFNSIRNTSYRPIYYHMYHGPTQAGHDLGYGYKIGVSFADAYNGAPVTDYSSGAAVANTKYSRTIEVVIDECVNCTAELNDVLEIEYDAYTANGTNDFANYTKLNSTYYTTNTLSANSAGRWVYNNAAADNGLRESGDVTDTSNIYLTYTKLTAGTNGIMRNSLMMQDSSGNWQSFTTTGGASTSGTPANKTPNTTTAFRPGSPIYYIASSSDINSGDVTMTAMVHAALLNLRYSINAYSITTGLPLFIKGTIHSDGYFYIDGDTTDLTVPWWTQSPNLLTDGAGKIYITVCEGTYDTYRGDLISSGEMWHFDENGIFCRYYPGTGDIDWGTWS